MNLKVEKQVKKRGDKISLSKGERCSRKKNYSWKILPYYENLRICSLKCSTTFKKEEY